MTPDPVSKLASPRWWEQLMSLYNRLNLKYSIPFIILLLYTLFGAVIFYICEAQSDHNQRDAFIRNFNVASLSLMERFVELTLRNQHAPSLIYNETLDALMWYNEYLQIDKYLDERMMATPWTWWGSVFYAGTLYTTIGYGRPSPKTTAGKVFTCIYSLIGIPLFLTILKEIGKLLTRLMRKIWIKSKRSWAIPKLRPISMKNKPNNSGSVNRNGSIKGILSEDMEMIEKTAKFTEEQLKTTFNKQSKIPFPVSFALGVLLFWIFSSAGLFVIWEEDWDYWTAVYFVVISLTTIGLGDVIPSKPAMMLANFLLVLVGLALLSMCFNIVQIRIEELLDDMLHQFLLDFDQVADAIQHNKPYSMGISGIMPLQKFGGRKWLNLHLAKILNKSKDRNEKKRRMAFSDEANISHSDEEEEAKETNEAEAELFKTMQVWTTMQDKKIALKHRFLKKLIDKNRVEQLEEVIRQKVTQSTTGTQTDASELLCTKCQTALTSQFKSKYEKNCSIISIKDWLAFCDIDLTEAVIDEDFVNPTKDDPDWDLDSDDTGLIIKSSSSTSISRSSVKSRTWHPNKEC